MMLGDGDTAPLLPFPPAPSSLPLSRKCVPPVTSRGAWKPSLSPLVWQSSCHWDSVAQDSSHHLAAQISVAAASAPQGAVQDAEAPTPQAVSVGSRGARPGPWTPCQLLHPTLVPVLEGSAAPREVLRSHAR